MKSGIYYDMPEDEYFELPFFSSSKAGVLLSRSAMHAQHAYQSAMTDAKAFGRLFHLMLLEPERAGLEVAVKPKDANKASNAGKRILLDWMEETVGIDATAGEGLAEGKMLDARIKQLEPEMAGYTICSHADYDRACAMVDSVMSRSICQVLFSRGKAEVSLIARDPASGVVCKGRIDWLTHDEVEVDAKSTLNCSYYAFSSDAERYGYHRQIALYKRLYAILTRQSEPEFLHVVVESKPCSSDGKHDLGVYELDAESVSAGRRDVDHALEIWARCEEKGIFPGTGWSWTDMEYTIQPLTLPKRAL